MDSPKTRRAVIIGATSGIGYEVAQLLLAEGWYLGIAGRRRENLLEFQKKSPDRIKICALDIRKEGAENELEKLIGELGGMDLFLQSSGIGFQNFELSPDIELNTLETNGTGFVRMVGYAFRYFRQQGKGHIAVISSIAGTKGLVPVALRCSAGISLELLLLEGNCSVSSSMGCFTEQARSSTHLLQGCLRWK